MWLIVPSVYKRCHDDADANHPTPLTKRMHDTKLADKGRDPDSTTRQALHAIELCLPVPKATLLN
jgi:hypothetical protein